MKRKALIDSKKKAAFREAMAKGKPELFFQKKKHDTLVDRPTPTLKTDNNQPREAKEILDRISTMLIEGAKKGDIVAVKVALDRGANIEAADDFDYEHLAADLNDLNQGSALMWAVNNNHNEVAEELVCRGASLHAKNKVGQTALMFACKNGNIEIIKNLIINGAEADTKDMFDRTALDYTEKKHQKAVFALFEELKAEGMIQ